MSPLLEALTARQGKVILAFKERLGGGRREQVVKEPRRQEVKQERKASQGDDLDLTGEPLEAGFDPNEEWNLSDVKDDNSGLSRCGPRLRGLSVAAARSWLSTTTEEGEHWALLEGRGGLYLGSRSTATTRTMSNVTWSGPSPPRLLQPQLGSVLARHRSSGGSGQARTAARAVYSLCGGEGGSKVEVVAVWSRVSGLLETPPLDCSLSLGVELVQEEEGAGRELLLLEGFVRGLDGEGVTWGGGGRLEERVVELLEEVREAGLKMGGGGGREDGDGGQERQDQDFTDRLWSALSLATSYQQLTRALGLVLETVREEELRPFLYSSNRTAVARVIQVSYACSSFSSYNHRTWREGILCQICQDPNL